MWSDRRLQGAGLAGSLLVNAFLLGLVLGPVVAWHRERPTGQPALGDPQSVDKLPEDQKAIFRAAFAAHRDAIREARRSHREVRAKAEVDIAAQSLDRAKVEADLVALHATNRDVEDATSAALLDALEKLTPASRATLAGRRPDASGP